MQKEPKSLSTWSARRVIVACVLWLVGAPVLLAIGFILAGLAAAAFSGNQRIAVSASIDKWSLGWFLLPPLLFVSAWVWMKARSKS